MLGPKRNQWCEDESRLTRRFLRCKIDPYINLMACASLYVSLMLSHHHIMKVISVGLTVIVWEADAQMNFLDLLFKEILLVEEKHDGGQCKESVVADTVE